MKKLLLVLLLLTGIAGAITRETLNEKQLWSVYQESRNRDNTGFVSGSFNGANDSSMFVAMLGNVPIDGLGFVIQHDATPTGSFTDSLQWQLVPIIKSTSADPLYGNRSIEVLWADSVYLETLAGDTCKLWAPTMGRDYTLVPPSGCWRGVEYSGVLLIGRNKSITTDSSIVTQVKILSASGLAFGQMYKFPYQEVWVDQSGILGVKTIAEAVVEAGVGYTIRVFPGTYTLDKQAVGNLTYFVAQTPGVATTFSGGDTLFTTTAKVVLDGFRVLASGTGNALVVSGDGKYHLKNCDVSAVKLWFTSDTTWVEGGELGGTVANSIIFQKIAYMDGVQQGSLWTFTSANCFAYLWNCYGSVSATGNIKTNVGATIYIDKCEFKTTGAYNSLLVQNNAKGVFNNSYFAGADSATYAVLGQDSAKMDWWSSWAVNQSAQTGNKPGNAFKFASDDTLQIGGAFGFNGGVLFDSVSTRYPDIYIYSNGNWGSTSFGFLVGTVGRDHIHLKVQDVPFWGEHVRLKPTGGMLWCVSDSNTTEHWESAPGVDTYVATLDGHFKFKGPDLRLRIGTNGTDINYIFTGTTTFTTTAARKAIYISGITTADIAVVSPMSSVAPVAGDAMAVYCKTDSVIVTREGTTPTSDLPFGLIVIRKP